MIEILTACDIIYFVWYAVTHGLLLAVLGLAKIAAVVFIGAALFSLGVGVRAGILKMKKARQNYNQDRWTR